MFFSLDDTFRVYSRSFLLVSQGLIMFMRVVLSLLCSMLKPLASTIVSDTKLSLWESDAPCLFAELQATSKHKTDRIIYFDKCDIYIIDNIYHKGTETLCEHKKISLSFEKDKRNEYYSIQSSTVTSKVIGTNTGWGLEPSILYQGQLGAIVIMMTEG